MNQLCEDRGGETVLTAWTYGPIVARARSRSHVQRTELLHEIVCQSSQFRPGSATHESCGALPKVDRSLFIKLFEVTESGIGPNAQSPKAPSMPRHVSWTKMALRVDAVPLLGFPSTRQMLNAWEQFRPFSS